MSCRKSSYNSSNSNFFRYQTNEPLLSAVNDNTRNLLYTLSASSSIQVFYLGEKCDSLSFLVELSQIPKKAKALLNSGAISQDEVFFTIIFFDNYSRHRVLTSKISLWSTKMNRAKSAWLLFQKLAFDIISR